MRVYLLQKSFTGLSKGVNLKFKLNQLKYLFPITCKMKNLLVGQEPIRVEHFGTLFEPFPKILHLAEKYLPNLDHKYWPNLNDKNIG